MKYVFILFITFTLPWLALAEPSSRQIKKLTPEERQEVLSNINHSDGNLNKTVDRPQLERLRMFKPSNPSEAFSFHQTLLTERIERIKQNTVIPEDKKLLIIDDLTEESEWMQTKREQLQSATAVERLTIQQEIIDHIQSVREEHRQKLAESVVLSEKSPKELVEQIGERFVTISEQLATAGYDTSSVNQAITDYETAMTALNEAYAVAQTEKSVETLTTLRDAIATTREAASTVRNQVQSLVMEQRGSENN